MPTAISSLNHNVMRCEMNRFILMSSAILSALSAMAQTRNIAATREYCDHNRTVAAQEAVVTLRPELQTMVVDEVDRVSQSFVTNAYPVPVPVTNTIYKYTETIATNYTYTIQTNIIQNTIGTNITYDASDVVTNIAYDVAYQVSSNMVNESVDDIVSTILFDKSRLVISNEYLLIYRNDFLLWKGKGL